MSLDVRNGLRAPITTAAQLVDALSAEQVDELEARIERAGWIPELAGSKRKAGGESGGILPAVNAWKVFHGVPIEATGPEVLKLLRRPRCGLPDDSRRDPKSGKLRRVEPAITFGRWRRDHEVTLAYRFSRTPDAGDAITAAEVRLAFKHACELWTTVCGIRLTLIDDFDAANIRVADGHEDGPFGTLAWMELPGPGEVAGRHVCRGLFDWGEAWGLYRPGKPLSGNLIDLLDVAAHEIGHALGMDHEPGNRQERLNPIYHHFPHQLSGEGPPFVGPKDTRTLQAGYGPPRAAPKPEPDPEPPGPDPEPPHTPGRKRGRVVLYGSVYGQASRIASSVAKYDGGIFLGEYEEYGR